MTKVVAFPSDFSTPSASNRAHVLVLFRGQAPTPETVASACTARNLPCRSDGDGWTGELSEIQVHGTASTRRIEENLTDLVAASVGTTCTADSVQTYEAVVDITGECAADKDRFELHGIVMAYAATIAGLPGACAVYNPVSLAVSEPGSYATAMASVFQGSVPTAHWFATVAGTSSEGLQTLSTRGLPQFGACDFEIVAPADRDAAASMLAAAAYDAVARSRQRRTPESGQVIAGASGQATLAAAVPRQGLSPFLDDGMVYELSYGNDQALDDLLERDGDATPEYVGRRGVAEETEHTESASGAEGSTSVFRPADDGSRTSEPDLGGGESASYGDAPVPSPVATSLEGDASPASGPAPRPEQQSPAQAQGPLRGLVLLVAPVDLTQVAHDLQAAGLHVQSLNGPELRADAGAFAVTLVGRNGLVPDHMWTVQPSQQTCLALPYAPQACHVVVELTPRDGGYGTVAQQEQARRTVLAAVAGRPVAVAVVHEEDREATPARTYVEKAR